MHNIVHKLYNIVQNIVHIQQVEKLYNRKMGLKTKLYKFVYNIVHIVQCCTIIYVILYNFMYNIWETLHNLYLKPFFLWLYNL